MTSNRAMLTMGDDHEGAATGLQLADGRGLGSVSLVQENMEVGRLLG
jgi:hypothetical protein